MLTWPNRPEFEIKTSHDWNERSLDTAVRRALSCNFFKAQPPSVISMQDNCRG